MTSKKKETGVLELPVVEESVGEPTVEVAAELIIKVFTDGSLEVNVPENRRELSPSEVEGITRTVYEQLRDSRIAQTAVELFKARLG